jgi:fatty-acyl-CoA synthase
MSEAGSVFFMPIDIDQIRSRPQSVGIGVPGIASRVVDANLQDCPPGVPGELLLKGENIFLGYWPNPTHDQTAFTEDGWFRTGDIVQWRGGYFDLIDRKKDMYISGGENVYPAESEVALAGYPGVAEIAVIGVPDARWGEVGHAFLVPCAGQHLDVGAIEAFLAKKIAKYKLPKHWSIVDALPRTPSGKVQKAALRQRSSNSMF